MAYKVTVANSIDVLKQKLGEISVMAGDIINIYHDSSSGLHVAWHLDVADITSPVVRHHDVANGKTAGTNVRVTAQILPPEIDSVILYYRTTGAPAYQSVSMDLEPIGTGYFSSLIPAGSVAAPSVDYYIEASDGTNTTSVGNAGAPKQFTVT